MLLIRFGSFFTPNSDLFLAKSVAACSLSMTAYERREEEVPMKNYAQVILSVLALMMIHGTGTASVESAPKNLSAQSSKCL